MKVKSLHHIAVCCRSEEEYSREIHLYRDVLELPVVSVVEDGEDSCVLFSTGNSMIELFKYGRGEDAKGTIAHIAFEVDDVDALAAEVAKAGYEITTQPENYTYPDGTKIRYGFFKCPAGEEIELYKYL